MSALQKAVQLEMSALYREMIDNHWTRGVAEFVYGENPFRVVLERDPGSKFVRVVEGRKQLQELMA